MSEEAKTPDGDYVMMGSAGAKPGHGANKMDFLNDPNLSQEEKDHRMAVALQQQENSAVHASHEKKHQAYVKAQTSRTARSGTFSKLAAVRDKDHGQYTVPSEYTTENAYHKEGAHNLGPFVPPAGATPQEVADAQMAYELQKAEQMDAGTAQEMRKIIVEEKNETNAQTHRTGWSNYNKPKKH